jgi:WD40 repeat protein
MGAITTPTGAMYFSFHPRVLHQVSAGAGKNVSLMAFSPDDRFLATVVSPDKGSPSAGDTVKLWNVASATLAAQFTTTGPVISLAFSHDGTLVATGQQNDALTVWNTGTGAAQHTLRTDGKSIGALAFSPSGDTLAAVDGDQVTLWDAATGQQSGTLPGIDGTQGGTALAYSPDGKTLAVGYANGTTQLWDTATGTTDGGLLPAATPKAKGGQSIARLAFSADGTMLVSLDQDGVATPWPTSLFTDPYAALCAEVGAMSATAWAQYMPKQQEPAGTCSDVSGAASAGTSTAGK